MLWILFSLLCVKYIFSFGFIEALDSKGIINMLRKVLRQPWNALTLQLLLSLCDKYM